MPNTYRKVYPGIRSGGFEVMAAKGNFMTGVNAYLDAASGNWYRIDESKAAWGLVISVTNGCKVYWAGPGTGAISWTEISSLDSLGILSIANDLDFNGYSALNLKSAMGVVNCSAYASFSDAINAIGAEEKTLLITDETPVTTNVTVPENVELAFTKTGKLTVADGVTLTINGGIRAGLHQIFSYIGTGTIAGNPKVAEYYPQWWGALGDGSHDDTAAIQSAIDFLPEGATLYFSEGAYITSAELSLTGKRFITIKGAGLQESHIYCTGNNIRSVLSLLGADYIYLENIEIYSGNPTNSPDAVLIFGRTSGEHSFGHHKLERVMVRGYASKALVYSIASEENSFDDVFFRLDGGGAKYVFYTSQSDDLGLGGFSSQTNLSLFFHHFRMSSSAVGDDASVIYINGRNSTGDIYFRDGFMHAEGGSFITINTNAGNPAYGTFVFDSIRGECAGGIVQGIHLTKTGDGLVEVFRLIVTNCNWSGSLNYFLYGDTDVKLVESSLQNNISNAPHFIQLHSAQEVFILNPSPADISVSTNLFGSIIITNGAFNNAVNHGNNLIMDYYSPGSITYDREIIQAPAGYFRLGQTVPGSPAEGDMYWDATEHVLKVYDGTAWRTVNMT